MTLHVIYLESELAIKTSQYQIVMVPKFFSHKYYLLSSKLKGIYAKPNIVLTNKSINLSKVVVIGMPKIIVSW